MGVSFETTNLIESVMARLEAKTRRVTHWRTSDQKFCWCASALWTMERQFRRVKNHRHLPLLKQALQAQLSQRNPQRREPRFPAAPAEFQLREGPTRATMTTRVTNTLVGTLLFAIVLAIALMARTAYHAWGDDWAAYLLQARALAAGNAAGELTRNARLIALGEGAFPSAAPWGFPALLAFVGGTVGWSFASLKLVGIVSVALAALFAFAIARFYLPVVTSALVALTLALSSGVLEHVDGLGSDVPFLAFSIAALFLIEWSMRGPDTRGQRAVLMVAIVVVATAAFTIRTNGIFLFPCAGVGVLIRWFHTRSRAQLVMDA